MNYKEIKDIISDMSISKLDTLAIEFPDGTKVSMSKSSENKKVVATDTVEVISRVEEQIIKKEEIKEEGIFITSPIVGTFYESSAPDKAPYVKVGDKVKKGDIICIIEAMKLINEIASEEDGEIKEILVKNGDIVDFGKPLFKII